MKHILIFTLLSMFLSCSLFSQEEENTSSHLLSSPYEVTRDYSFIQYSLDTLHFSLDTSLLVPFFEKLHRVEGGSDEHLNIIHIGGSHVQGGTFPHAIRRELLLHHDTCAAERGMIFPYSVAPKCNNPRDYTVSDKGKFGLIRNVYETHKRPLQTTGIAVFTGDTIAEFTIGMNEPAIPFSFQTISLLAFSDSNTIIPTIRIDTNEFFPTTIDTLKDRFIYQLPAITDSFTVQCNVPYGDTLYITGIYLGEESPGVTSTR